MPHADDREAPKQYESQDRALAWQQLEPNLADEHWMSTYHPSEAHIEHSKAISAKRSADAMELIAARLDHLTDYFGDGKAELRVHANVDTRQS